MSLAKEFKEFAMKGNVVDMAIGVIVGAAFGKVVSSMVADVITPPLGVVLGGVDFTSLAITIKGASEAAPAVTLNYGKFIQSVFDFSIIAAALFIVIKLMNKIRRKSEESPSSPTQEQLLAEIRDILKEGSK